MTAFHPQFIIDTAGNSMVVISKKEFDHLMDELDELEDIRLYDEAKKSDEDSIPIDEAFMIIEAER